MVYLTLDENNYLVSAYTSGVTISDEVPRISSIEEYDFSGIRMGAYFWDGEKLIFNNERYNQLLEQQQQEDLYNARLLRKEGARGEITDAVLTATINTLEVNDVTALRWIDFYPDWVLNNAYEPLFKVQYDDRLWRCRQAHTSQIGWEPPNVPALWEEISEAHSGTIDDPIPYNNNMTLENGKYYSQFGVTYHCIRDTGAPVYNNLADLVGLYVEIA